VDINWQQIRKISPKYTSLSENIAQSFWGLLFWLTLYIRMSL